MNVALMRGISNNNTGRRSLILLVVLSAAAGNLGCGQVDEADGLVYIDGLEDASSSTDQGAPVEGPPGQPSGPDGGPEQGISPTPPQCEERNLLVSAAEDNFSVRVDDAIRIAIQSDGLQPIRYRMPDVSPARSALDQRTGMFNWTPLDQHVGDHLLRFEARDSCDNVGYLDLAVEVVRNSAPVLSPVGELRIDEHSQLTVRLEATDVDGGPLNFSASNLPNGANFDQEQGVFRWVPRSPERAEAVVFRVRDDRGAEDSEEVDILVNEILRPEVDADGDGFSEVDDCDDTDPLVRPLSQGLNRIDSDITICAGTYNSWLSLSGSNYTVQTLVRPSRGEIFTVLERGWIQMIDTTGVTVDGMFIRNGTTAGRADAGCFQVHGGGGNQLHSILVHCREGRWWSASITESDENRLTDFYLHSFVAPHGLYFDMASEGNTVRDCRIGATRASLAHVVDGGVDNSVICEEFFLEDLD